MSWVEVDGAGWNCMEVDGAGLNRVHVFVIPFLKKLKQNISRFFFYFYDSNDQLFFGFKNKNCCYLCRFYPECAFELNDRLI